MMKPLTSEEVRAWIASLPAEHQPGAARVAWSCVDMGVTLGLAGEARLKNPFEALLLTEAAQVVANARGKAR